MIILLTKKDLTVQGDSNNPSTSDFKWYAKRAMFVAEKVEYVRPDGTHLVLKERYSAKEEKRGGTSEAMDAALNNLADSDVKDYLQSLKKQHEEDFTYLVQSINNTRKHIALDLAQRRLRDGENYVASEEAKTVRFYVKPSDVHEDNSYGCPYNPYDDEGSDMP